MPIVTCSLHIRTVVHSGGRNFHRLNRHGLLRKRQCLGVLLPVHCKRRSRCVYVSVKWLEWQDGKACKQKRSKENEEGGRDAWGACVLHGKSGCSILHRPNAECDAGLSLRKRPRNIKYTSSLYHSLLYRLLSLVITPIQISNTNFSNIPIVRTNWLQIVNRSGLIPSSPSIVCSFDICKWWRVGQRGASQQWCAEEWK